MRIAKPLILLALIATNAHAKIGGTSGGGGNTLHGHLIETYGGHSVHELKGYDAGLARLAALVPTFALRQNMAMARKNIYLIPEAFGPLPVSATELAFQTDLPCYQTTDEMFCNPEKLDGMEPKEREDLFIHEALMNARLADTSENTPTIGDLRAAVSVLIRPNVTDQAAADALANHNFDGGVTMTAYKKANRYRAAIEKGVLDVCRAGFGKWDLTNDGNPYFKLQGGIEHVLGDFGAGMDVRRAWAAEDAALVGVTSDISEVDGQNMAAFCRGLFKKYTTR